MNPRFQPWSGRRRCPRRSASSAAQRRLLLRRPPPPLDLRPRREQPWVGNIKKVFPPSFVCLATSRAKYCTFSRKWAAILFKGLKRV